MSLKYKDIKNRLKVINDQNKEIHNSASYLRVIGVLSGLGFLIAPNIKPCANSKIDFEEAFKIGISIEPRVLEVLPAAILSFPKSFLHYEKASVEFKQLVEAIRKGKVGADYNGIKFDKFYQAAIRPIKNRKRKIMTERRISKTFRLRPAVVNEITRRSKELGLDQTAYIESLIV